MGKVQSIEQIVKRQNTFFDSGLTKDLNYRINALNRLKVNINKMSDEICEAIYKDLGRSNVEAYMTEIGMSINEISHMLKHIRKYSRTKKVHTPLAIFPATSYIIAEPYGTVLVMSPWNYPFLLAIGPTIDAIAAGNTVVIKPSAYSPHTSAVIAKLFKKCFRQDYVTVVEGGRAVNNDLLEQKFNYIFFTGGKVVGKLVMEKAAAHLTPVTLELGGKSPCIVDETANLKLAAKRIIFGKLLNAGQTCVAPDYLFVQEKVKDKLVSYMIRVIKEFYGDDPLTNENYPKVINEKHFRRLQNLISGEHILLGGNDDGKQKIAPTIMDQITGDSKIMHEEIFGPILPIMTYKSLDEVINFVIGNPKPLALYFFTQNKLNKERILKELSFGGGCINDTIMHLATNNMGFGGVGESGMGSYHGKHGFDTFSHYKSIVDKKNWFDPPMRYQPNINRYAKIIKILLKYNR